MKDLYRWIYAEDIAGWLSGRPPMDVWEQADCILSAPHRTLREKLERLRGLKTEAGDVKYLEKCIEFGEYIERRLDCGRRIFHELYEADVFHHGRKEEIQERKIFRAPKVGTDYLKKQMEEKAAWYETDPGEYFGVLCGFCDRTTVMLEHRWSLIVNSDGEVIYCLPESADHKRDMWPVLGALDSHYIRLPYASGTLVEMMENPFFPPMKGILVNEAEPWEEGFDREDQWLLYPDLLHGCRQGSISVIKLDDYASITFGGDILLPFCQFLCGCEGELSENEGWLHELGSLVKEDKGRCMSLIMRDARPKKYPGPSEELQCHVKELAVRMSGKRRKG